MAVRTRVVLALGVTASVVVVSLGVAVFFLATKEWFGAGDLGAFALWTVPFGLLAAGAAALLRPGLGRGTLGKLAGIGLLGVFLTVIWTLCVRLVLGGWFLAFSIPVPWSWLAGAWAGLLVASRLGHDAAGRESPERGQGLVPRLWWWAGRLGLVMLSSAALAVVVLFGGLGTGLAYDSWQFEKGAVIPAANGSSALWQGAGQVVYLDGWERVSISDMREIRLMQAVVLTASSDSHGSGSSSETDRWIARQTLMWKADPSNDEWENEPRLVLELDARERVAKIGDRVFDATRGNVFVVHLGPDWEISDVQQAGVLVSERVAPDEVLAVAKEALPHIETLQRVVLHWEGKEALEAQGRS